jgi:hypothetical protein
MEFKIHRKYTALRKQMIVDANYKTKVFWYLFTLKKQQIVEVKEKRFGCV